MGIMHGMGSEDYIMGEEQNSRLRNQKKHKSVLKGGTPSDTYNTSYNYGKMDASKTESKLGKVLIIILTVMLVVIAVVAALSYFKVI